MRKGFDGLAARVQITLRLDPHGGALFVFRGRGPSAHELDPWGGDLIKVLWWDGQGLCLFAKPLERGRFLWPQAKDGSVVLTAAQLSMLLEGIDWRAPRRSWAPEVAG
jgi:transposase